MQTYDLIILVYACYTIDKYREQIKCINETWGKKCEQYNNIKLIYFLGENHIDDFSDTERTQYINIAGVKDDYLSASYKQFLGLAYIYNNYNPKFVICIGTDTYLNIPKLLVYINEFDYNENLYIGGHGCNRMINSKNYYYHSGGPGFIITYTCLQKIYNKLPNLMDTWIHICNEYNVDNLVPACDVAISYFLQQCDINVTIIKMNDLSFLHCNYYGHPCHLFKVDITQIVSCHSMNINDFYYFTNILNRNNYFTK